jgi:hypothetical protein
MTAFGIVLAMKDMYEHASDVIHPPKLEKSGIFLNFDHRVHVAYLVENHISVSEEENIEHLKGILDDILEKKYSVNLFARSPSGPLTFAEIFERLQRHNFEEPGKESGYDVFEVDQYCEWVDRKIGRAHV